MIPPTLEASTSTRAVHVLVVHAAWSDDALHIWAEHHPRSDGPAPAGDDAHPFAADAATVGAVCALSGDARHLAMRLPTGSTAPIPSPRLAHWLGETGEEGVNARLERWRVPTLAIAPDDVEDALARIEERCDKTESHRVDEAAAHESEAATHVSAGASLRFFATAARFAKALRAEQRVVPSLMHSLDGPLAGAWEPWLSDKSIAPRAAELLRAMPPAARSVDDEFSHEPAAVLRAYLEAITDAGCRRALRAQQMEEAIEDKPADADPHVGWLTGLLGTRRDVVAADDAVSGMVRSVRRWIGGLDERGVSVDWRLLLIVEEPLLPVELPDFASPGDDASWRLRFLLQSAENEEIVVDAEDVWTLRGETASVEGHRIDKPQELMLAELGRASRIFPKLEHALSDSAPTDLALTTREAYEFLREIGPLLREQGVGVKTPDWWDTPSARLGARLQLFDAPPTDASGSGPSPTNAAEARLGLNALVGYEWSLAVGDTPITMEDFQRLAEQRAPLVQIGGKWVEIRQEDIAHAVKFINDNPGGSMRFGEALRMAYAYDLGSTGVPVVGIDASGWVSALLGQDTADGATFKILEPPEGFQGELRPYQVKGMSWMAFLDRLGLGPCLADDMGLGKTIQQLALLQHEKNEAEAAGTVTGPTLIVVPMSIVGNWMREAAKFAPGLKVMIHHGVDRKTGDEFIEAALSTDLIITTYALANRDRDLLDRVPWARLVLDEAQNIKNPSAKQSQAVRSLEAPRRIALTGTPLENRLSELWSIMDFCNPGFLGSAGEFRRSFGVPIERHRDKQKANRLRQLVRPFILRRLKTDPLVISDLPDKLETREFCRLTSEQATLYESAVKTMLSEVDRSEGIRRRGVVLTALIRLKQICNHPELVLRAQGSDKSVPGTPAASRSGKCIRLLELLDEVVASGESALVFTQFRQMGHLLSAMLRQALDREVLFLHGGTPQAQREKLVERFQKGDGSCPVFLLSLKAGGVGLNLTAASHVFHFDRWWNPAVENQATDRAFRIGQTKTVNVHKFVVSGTLEERIDQMIESKIALAEDVIGSGEDWLTELSSDQLADVLRLRPDALGDGEEG